jgi:hypothetical protein
MIEYTGPIAVGASTSIAAVAVKDGMADSELLVATYTYNALQLAEPVATPSAAAPYHAAFTVTLSGPEGAAVYYTTDNTDPTTSNDVYSAAIDITQNTTLKAVAVKTDMLDSAVMTAGYTLSPETPTAVQTDSAVTLATATADAAISYTVDGSDPAASDTKTTYTTGTPITLSAGTTTVKAVATKANWANSAVFSGTFTHTVGSANPPSGDGDGGDSDLLTDAVYFNATINATTVKTLSATSGTQEAPTWKLSIEEEPAVYFEVEKSAAQTITVCGTDGAKVTKITADSSISTLDGSTASATADRFSVNMEDLLFGGETNGNTIPSGIETRTFTLKVSEPSHTSRVITVALALSLDTDTDTTIYHREGEPGNYHYVKVRDAKLTNADKTNYAYTGAAPDFTALTIGPVTDLQNAFVWVDHHGSNESVNATLAVDSFASATPSTDGYSEYRLFVKKNQEIGKINLMFINSKAEIEQTYGYDVDTDLRNYMSIELYGAGSSGGQREQTIKRSTVFSVMANTQMFNYTPNKAGFIGLVDSSSLGIGNVEMFENIQRHKALVLGKNITLAGDGEDAPFGTSPGLGSGQASDCGKVLGASALIGLEMNALVIIDNGAKITGYYGSNCPINVSKYGKLYLKGGAITGNTLTGNTYLINKGSSGTVIEGNTDTANNTGLSELTN